MGSSLGPILAIAFMVELKNTKIPKLHEHVKKWRRHVDGTFAYIKNKSFDVLATLNSLHPNINFTF